MINRKFTHHYIHGDNSIITFDPDQLVNGVPYVLLAFYNDIEVRCYYHEYDPAIGADATADALELHLYETKVISADDYVAVDLDIPDIVQIRAEPKVTTDEIFSLVTELIEDLEQGTVVDEDEEVDEDDEEGDEDEGEEEDEED